MLKFYAVEPGYNDINLCVTCIASDILWHQFSLLTIPLCHGFNTELHNISIDYTHAFNSVFRDKNNRMLK